jgi:hypothetical protein
MQYQHIHLGPFASGAAGGPQETLFRFSQDTPYKLAASPKAAMDAG